MASPLDSGNTKIAVQDSSGQKMSLPGENREELQKKLDGLESTIMIMAVQGLAVPDELANELAQVRIALDELGGEIQSRRWTSWLGQSIEGFTLVERLSHGTFSHLFRAQNDTTKEECAIKIACSDDAVGADAGDFFAKQAVSMKLEICQSLKLSANTALSLEAQRLQTDSCGAFVKVLSEGTVDKCFYYRMPLLQGQSLKELMELADTQYLPYSIDVFKRLCSILERLASSSTRYHGNLQPDSIFVSKTDIVLLSPGTFDPYIVSTPAYYPFFEPDDIFALGATFWETICKTHPLALKDKPERTQLFSPDLKEMLEYRKSLNHEPLWHFLRVVLPRDLRNDLSDNAETTMLKALKLGFESNGYLTGAPGFKTAGEFSQALDILMAQGLLRKRR